MPASIDIPAAWDRLDLSGLSGVAMVIGAPDAGKSTFARYLFQRLADQGRRTAFLDGDPGQASLGPPTTLTLILPSLGETDFPPHGKVWRWFMGSTSPAGHMLAVLVGAARLVHVAQSAGAQAVIYDTSGMVEPPGGGAALKFAKIELMQPSVVYAIQKDRELEPILHPLRRARRQRLILLEPSAAVQRRDVAERQGHRAGRFAAHFQNARSLNVEWNRLAVFPYPQFALNRLVAFQDLSGFTLSLGIVRSIDRSAHRVEILTPLPSLELASSIHIGDLFLDSQTFQDRRIV